MPIPPEARTQAEVALEEFCAKHSSIPGADRLRYAYNFETSSVVLNEQRPGFMNAEEWVSRPIAKFRYSEARGVWSLYWADADRRWHRVENAKAEKDIRVALQFVLTDPLGVFWS